MRQIPLAGIEAIVWSLTKNFSNRGYEVKLIAAPGSILSSKCDLIFSTAASLKKIVTEVISAWDPCVVCDHSLQNLASVINKKSIFKIVHIAPEYMEKFLPSPNIAFVSKFLRESFVLSWSKSFEHCQILQNGIEELPITHSSEIFVKMSDPVVYLGRVNKGKGIHLAARACDELELRFDIYGGLGSDAKASIVYNDIPYLTGVLKAYSSSRYHGVVRTKNQKAKALSSGFCVVLPSIIPESCSLVALEAASLGLPVITNRIGGTKEYLGNHGYYFLHSRSEKKTIERIKDCLENVIKTAKNPRKPYLAVEHTEEEMAKRYLALLGLNYS